MEIHGCSFHATRSNSDWLFITLLRVLQADRLTLEINEKAAWHIIMPYQTTNLMSLFQSQIKKSFQSQIEKNTR